MYNLALALVLSAKHLARDSMQQHPIPVHSHYAESYMKTIQAVPAAAKSFLSVASACSHCC